MSLGGTDGAVRLVLNQPCVGFIPRGKMFIARQDSMYKM